MKTLNRWFIALAGVLMQLALGAVYAWSIFQKPLVKQFDCSISEVRPTFTISIFVLGIAGGLSPESRWADLAPAPSSSGRWQRT